MQHPPRIWLVLADKAGDNSQVEALASALPWPFERKRIRLLEPWVLGKPRVAASLHHVDPSGSDPLEPPWPDLVLTIGRRPSMVALWIRERSGGRSRVVLVGKPSGMMQAFDLVIASAEVALPPLPSAFPIRLPLLRVDEEAVKDAVAAWRERLAPLPRPLVGFLVGGPTDPFVYDESVSRRLLALAREVRSGGGTPYVTTSRRTPPAVVESLAAGLPEGSRLFRWRADAPENPYLALLGLSDGLVVTGDSISMLVEVARLGRPLAILPLPSGRLGALDRRRRRLTRWLFAPGAGRLRAAVARVAFRSGVIRHTRDFGSLHRFLVESGLAVWAGEAFRPPAGPVPDDLPRAAARVRALVEQARADRAGAPRCPRGGR